MYFLLSSFKNHLCAHISTLRDNSLHVHVVCEIFQLSTETVCVSGMNSYIWFSLQDPLKYTTYWPSWDEKTLLQVKYYCYL